MNVGFFFFMLIIFKNFVVYVINFQLYVFQVTEELLWELLVQAGPVGRSFVLNHFRIIIIESS